MSIRRRRDPLEPSFKLFYELMARRVGEILLISSPYDAFIMEEDGRLAARIIHEYSGLNLTRPPRITWVSSAGEALQALAQRRFDLVITMARLGDMPPAQLCGQIRLAYPEMPIYFLSHQGEAPSGGSAPACQDLGRRLVWLGNTDILVALVKSTEDSWNVDFDTRAADVRVILLVEDSPFYLSSLLPFIYKEIMRQTRSVMDESLNEEHRILRMRARPKILLADSYEAALALYNRYAPYVLTVLCDGEFPMEGVLNCNAGVALLSAIHKSSPELTLLLFSADPANRAGAQELGVQFIDKGSAALHQEIKNFFVRFLGFDEFVFRLPEGREVARAATLRAMAQVLDAVPDSAIEYHARREDFSTWMMARTEVELARELRRAKVEDFGSIAEVRRYIREAILGQRKERQRGVVVDFGAEYDPTAQFSKIGGGSLGGKARGLAFMGAMLRDAGELAGKFPSVDIRIPPSVVLTTECFDAFMRRNKLQPEGFAGMSDAQIELLFTAATFPRSIAHRLASLAASVEGPLAVRSSSLLEDAQVQPTAGIFKTHMIPNSHPNPKTRLRRLLQAVQRVYASTYSASSRALARRSPYRTEEDHMAVVIQPVVGQTIEGWHYPAVSGVAQSYNFYPVAYMKPEEGIVHIAVGLGRTIVEGHSCLRFSPRYPQLLPQIDAPARALQNAQRRFFALRIPQGNEKSPSDPDQLIQMKTVDEMVHHPALRLLASTYVEADQSIRDSVMLQGPKLITFAYLLKYNSFPLPGVVADLLEMGRRGMGCPVEIEFALDLPAGNGRGTFWLLQIRPMARREQTGEVAITPVEAKNALCVSKRALGNGVIEVREILLVPPERFDPQKTVEIAAQISRYNRDSARRGERYLLIGPGRWGSADRHLGVPVAWEEISAVAAIVETGAAGLNADPSLGSHFFHNITTLGIGYLSVNAGQGSIDWDRLLALPVRSQTHFVRHLVLEKSMWLKIDGKNSSAALLAHDHLAQT